VAHDGLHGETDLHTTQLLCALRAQLSACPELADCSDLGAFIVKKYAPAARARGRQLVPSKNKRFAEFARVVALAPRTLYAEFAPYAEAEGESGDEWDDYGSDLRLQRQHHVGADAPLLRQDGVGRHRPRRQRARRSLGLIKPRAPPPSALGRQKLRVCAACSVISVLTQSAVRHTRPRNKVGDLDSRSGVLTASWLDSEGAG